MGGEKNMSNREKLIRDPVTAMQDRGPGFEAVFEMAG